MSPAVDLRTYLMDQGISPVFVGNEPDHPDVSVTLYDTGGFEPEPDQDMWRPTLQVRTRSRDYGEAYQMQEAIRDLLVLPASITVGSMEYFGIFMQSDIMSLGNDGNRRARLTANYRILRQEIK